MRTKSSKKSGISLIVLVITIIVIIILAVAVILSIANNNPIENANKAKFQNDLKSIQEELELVKSSNYAENKGASYNNKDGSEITITNLSSAQKYNTKHYTHDSLPHQDSYRESDTEHQARIRYSYLENQPSYLRYLEC